MDLLVVFGIDWRREGPEALSRFTFPSGARKEKSRELARFLGVEELFYLATCNRVEVALVAPPGASLTCFRPRIFTFFTGKEPHPGESEKIFRGWRGEGAAEHLFLVASGLLSAKVGENEIAGQFREAFRLCREAELCGPMLETILEEALKAAARVRRKAGFDQGRISLAEIALDRVRERLRLTPGSVALVGVSPMTVRCAPSLAKENIPILVVNRTLSAAQDLAGRFGGKAVSLARFREDPWEVEALVSATSSPVPVLSRSTLERLAARAPSGLGPLIVDMAVPPDVDPRDAEAVGLERLGMEEILAEAETNRERRMFEAAEARLLVDQALEDLRRRLVERRLGPILAALHRHYQETGMKGLERLFREKISFQDHAKEEEIRNWMRTLARRFAQVPTKGLRRLAHETGLTGVEAFLSEAFPSPSRTKDDHPDPPSGGENSR